MSDRIHDYLVIGAGPAGLQLAHELESAGCDYLVLEGGDVPGHSFTIFPRHRTLISSNKPHTGSSDPEFNLRMDWNSLLSDRPDLLFTSYTERYFPPADVYVRYLADFAEKLGLRVRYGTRVERVERDPEGFRVTDSRGGAHRGRRLVMATGVSQQPYIPPVPGIETVDQYATVSVDPKEFTDQRVLILGKANSALETADNLIETAAVIHLAGPHSLRLAWKTHFVGHVRAVNNNFLDTYQLKSQNAVLDGEVERIDRTDDGYLVRFRFTRADDVVKELRYDRVICCTGFRFDASVFADDVRPRLVIKDRFPEMTSAFESVNVPGMYFAGTLMQQRDFKKSTSGFIHGYRYAVRALGNILLERHEGRPWSHRDVPLEAEALTAAVLERVNRTSALWQLFGELGDLVVTGPGGARYHEEVPVAYAHDTAFAAAENLFTITLEYGPDHDKADPFDMTVSRVRQDAVDTARDASYLHPVIRHYRGGRFAAEHHVAENLENEWTRPDAHVAPLALFFAEALADTPAAGR